jgi:hypothetical protein
VGGGGVKLKCARQLESFVSVIYCWQAPNIEFGLAQNLFAKNFEREKSSRAREINDHNFLRFLPIFGEKTGLFLKKTML